MDPVLSTILMYVGISVAGVFLLVTFFSGFFTINQMEAGIVTRFGEFVRVARKGLNFKKPFLESVGKLDLTINQVELSVNAKTKDNFLLDVTVAVQYQVDLTNDKAIQDAYFLLDDPEQQIESYVSNAVLGHVQGMTFDEAFSQQTTTSREILTGLKTAMAQYGWNIIAVLIKELKPSAEVAAALSAKIATVRNAEGQAEAQRQAGIGVASERNAIMEGLSEAAQGASKALGITESSALHLIVVTQYLDTLRSMADNSNSTVIFADKSVSGMDTLNQEIAKGFLAASSTLQGK